MHSIFGERTSLLRNKNWCSKYLRPFNLVARCPRLLFHRHPCRLESSHTYGTMNGRGRPSLHGQHNPVATGPCSPFIYSCTQVRW